MAGLVWECFDHQTTTSQHIAMTRQIDSLSDRLMALENSLDIAYLQMRQHEDLLIKLTNHTSNAEVLDKMHEFQHQFESSVETVHQSLALASQEFLQLHANNRIELRELSENISQAMTDDLNLLHQSINVTLGSTQNNLHMEMQRTLSSVTIIEQSLSDELNSARIELKGNVDKALLTMNGIQQDLYDQMHASHQLVNHSIAAMERQVEQVLIGAIHHVNQVELNVTEQLELMTSYVNYSVTEVGLNDGYYGK